MMKMNKNFPYYLSKYLKDYLIIERNMSKHTLRSYKKTFQLLIEYLIKEKDFKLENITFETITVNIIVDFLNYLEEEKNNSISTRNQRLGCIKSFCEFCLTEEIENIENINRILKIKAKKHTQNIPNYLTEKEMKELLNSIDTTTKIGRRDLVILTLLYDTAARASEIINLKMEDIRLEEEYIILTGKGNKQRIVPIMNNTKELLKEYFKEFEMSRKYIFENNKFQKCNSNFIWDILKKYTKNIAKDISPHSFRHSRAIHLLSNGVSLIVLRDFLGHASVKTTEKYARVLEKYKLEAIKKAELDIKSKKLSDWNDDKNLLNQLLKL